MKSPKETYVNIHYCSIRPDRMTFYSMSEKPRQRSLAQIANQIHLQYNEKNDDYSWKSRKRINNALAWLLELSKNERYYSIRHHRHFNLKVSFITLTLASKQLHDDNAIKSKLLDQFLTEIRTQFCVEHYIWCAEPQHNGNLHFHLTTNKYIPWWEIRRIWNRVQDKLGYTSRFFDKFGHDNPNSIDVHSVRNIKNLPAYLYKYFTKENLVRPIQGRRWGLSQSLSRLQACVVPCYDEIYDETATLCRKFKHKLQMYDYANVLYLPISYVKKMNLPTIVRKFTEYVVNTLNPPPLLQPI